MLFSSGNRKGKTIIDESYISRIPMNFILYQSIYPVLNTKVNFVHSLGSNNKTMITCLKYKVVILL